MTTVALPIDQLIGLCFTIGLLIPVLIVSLAGGYILASVVFDRFAKTVLGTHVRHLFVRIAPAKRFDEDDQSYILNTIRRAIADGNLQIPNRRKVS